MFNSGQLDNFLINLSEGKLTIVAPKISSDKEEYGPVYTRPNPVMVWVEPEGVVLDTSIQTRVAPLACTLVCTIGVASSPSVVAMSTTIQVGIAPASVDLSTTTYVTLTPAFSVLKTSIVNSIQPVLTELYSTVGVGVTPIAPSVTTPVRLEVAPVSTSLACNISVALSPSFVSMFNAPDLGVYPEVVSLFTSIVLWIEPDAATPPAAAITYTGVGSVLDYGSTITLTKLIQASTPTTFVWNYGALPIPVDQDTTSDSPSILLITESRVPVTYTLGLNVSDTLGGATLAEIPVTVNTPWFRTASSTYDTTGSQAIDESLTDGDLLRIDLLAPID